MKLFNKYLFIASIGLISFSCAEEDFRTFDEQYVAFSAASASLVESSAVVAADGAAAAGNNELILTLQRSARDFSAPLTVGITATATFTDDSDFFAAGDDASSKIVPSVDLSAVVIPANQSSVSFSIGLVEDLLATGDVSVSFDITSVSDGSYAIGQQASDIRGSFSLTIVDDDCPIDLPGLWAGEYTVESFCAAPGSNNDGFCRTTGVVGSIVTLAADPSDPLGVTAILSGGIHAEPVTMVFQTCPLTVSIDAGYDLTFAQNGSDARILPPDEPEVYGTGSFNEGSLAFNLVVTYSNQDGSNFDEFIIEYKKAN